MGGTAETRDRGEDTRPVPRFRNAVSINDLDRNEVGALIAVPAVKGKIPGLITGGLSGH